VIVQGITVGPLEENCWLLADEVSGDAVLVDPGDEPEVLLAALDATGCTLRAIWLTHAHVDHVGAVAPIVRARDVPVYSHPADRFYYDGAPKMGAMYGMRIEPLPEPTGLLAEGSSVALGTNEFAVWHVPGHAPGHVAFIGAGLCISGDVLFAGSIGRTDLPLCDPRAMHQSLQRLATLAADTRVLPGHGPDTSISRELASNPFLRGLARPVGA
jgi:glyoxylase-like metal-dependent hydrolase (beta-lactamase superfamily II)